MILMFTRRFGTLDAQTTGRIRELMVPQLEELAVALLDFTQIDDLYAWLDRNPPAEPSFPAESADAAQA